MSSPKIKFLTNQTDILDRHDIVYQSIEVDLKFDEENNKYKKTPFFPRGYKNMKLDSIFDKSKNSSFIPMGKNYNGLIGVDIDNKDDTIEFFNNLSKENGYDLNTLTVDTINNGKHYYFYLNDEQQNALSDFKSADGLCFSTEDHPIHIDIKYTNQVLFGPSYFLEKRKAKKYVIVNESKPDTLPEYLFNEILRIHKSRSNPKAKANANRQTTVRQTTVRQNNVIASGNELNSNVVSIDELNPIIKRLRIYLNRLDPSRFDNRQHWLTIGSIIYNESKCYPLFEEYSKKSKKYDRIGCINLWNSFSEEHNIKATISKLIDFVEEDLKGNEQEKIKAFIEDKQRIINDLFSGRPHEHLIAYLFCNIKGDSFIYDNDNNIWYAVGKYGIFIKNKGGTKLKAIASHELQSVLKKEYFEALSKINEGDITSTKKLNTINACLMKYTSSVTNINVMTSHLKSLLMVDNINSIMDSHPNLIGFDNGVYDLKLGLFRKAETNEYISVTTGYNYKPANKNLKKEAMAIFKSIFPDRKELRYILKHMALGLYGENPEEKFYIWEGTGSNGKGVLRDIIKVVLGDYFDSMDISYLYKNSKKDANNANSIMAKKKNCRFVVSTEPETDQPINHGILKSISGNDEQQVRELYGSSFNYVPVFKLVIQTNEEPEFEAFDGGIKRRIILIKFPMKFVEFPSAPHERKIDTNLKRIITREKKYINEFFEILADHFKFYLEEGMDLPKRFKKDTNRLIKDNDPFNEWFDSNILVTKKNKDKIKSKELYEDYIDFMDGNNKGITLKKIKGLLMSRGAIHKKECDGAYYTCIVFKEVTSEINFNSEYSNGDDDKSNNSNDSNEESNNNDLNEESNSDDSNEESNSDDSNGGPPDDIIEKNKYEDSLGLFKHIYTIEDLKNARNH